ncbi:MAG: hypothetical protein EXS30_05885 [Pedosphaera sp.]|nr:hypothetical protein [Pedosphaera sp.]
MKFEIKLKSNLGTMICLALVMSVAQAEPGVSASLAQGNTPSASEVQGRGTQPQGARQLAQAGTASAKSVVPGKPYMEMDYGPFFTASVEVGQNNIAYKGVAIRLDEGDGGVSKGKAFVIFDTDLMRYAAGWGGEGFIDWKGIALDGQHGVHPAIVGATVFTNPVAPGWANPESGSFEDPRFRGLDQKPYGPLPRSWSHYKGVYVHGNLVILSYTVGDSEVLESPGYVQSGNIRALSRTLQIGKSSHDLLLRVSPENVPTWVVGPAALEIKGNDGFNLLRIPASMTPLVATVFMANSRVPAELRVLRALGASTPKLADIGSFTKGGPSRWPLKLATQVQRGPNDGPYAIDTLALPTDNPWRSWMRLGGFDFFADGRRAAVCTWQGDVWIVDGLGDSPEKLIWQRIASGMFQPLGLKIIDEKIFVTCRDQITILHDLNGDGETDFYENFNNDAQVTEHFHEFAMDLQVDASGNLYYAKAARHAKEPLVPHHGTLIKVSKDGARSEILASGFRAPNGVCLNPDGSFVISDQEGHWTPMNRINWVKPGGFYGNLWSYSPGRAVEDYDPPLCWIHKNMDRSPAEQLWVTSDKWGPLKGALLSLSYGTGRIWNVLYEQSGEWIQGGIVRLPLPEFPTGIMRGRFSPRDGQLYACGLFGWAGNKTQPGGFYRVRYTGKPLHIPTNLLAVRNGVVITFTNPLDPTSARDPQNYGVARWNYQRTANYGSADYKLSDGTKGRDQVEVSAVKVSKDRRSVFLQIPDMRICMQMEIQCDVVAADGTRVSQVIGNTINFLSDLSKTLSAPFEGK